MRKHWGLRAKMAGSYVLVTAAAVAVVELVVAIIVLPGLLAGVTSDNRSLIVNVTARDLASTVSQAQVRLGRLPTAEEVQLGEPGLQLMPGEAAATADGTGVRIPYTTTALDDSKPMSLALLIDVSGRILASSYPARYPVGRALGEVAALPQDILAKFTQLQKVGGDVTKLPGGAVLWAIAPVPNGDKAGARTAAVYVQVPADTSLPISNGERNQSSLWNSLSTQLGVGLLVLLVALPVGAVFGLFSTRRLLGRIRRLAASTTAVADGDFERRIPVSGADELAQLETSFNRMAARLSDAISAERQVAGANERARIARELHDSISQDLFSLRLLTGGLRRALPAGSPLHAQVDAMEQTATGTMHEMQALLFELRPLVLRDAGLLAALTELSRAYTDRLGVTVVADLEPVELDPAAEHAILRIVQEGLANAVKHARPGRIALTLRRDGEQVLVSVADDGDGFDPARAAERHGLGLEVMRERVAELGGTFHLDSARGRGTTIEIRLP